MLQTWPIHFFFDDTASPPLRLEHQFRAWRTPQQHHGMAALAVTAMFRHVRWLYNLIRVSKAAAVFDAFFLGSHQQEPFRQSQSGLVVSCLLALGHLLLSQKTTSEHTVKQACLSSCCIVRGGPLQGFFLTGFQKELSWKYSLGESGSQPNH